MNHSRRLFGVPVHPLLVHFPIVFWLTVPLLDLAILLDGPNPWWNLAQAATLAGLAFGAAALLFGFLDYRDPKLAGIDLRLAARHGVRTSLAWCAFTVRAVLAALLPLSTATLVLSLTIDLIGCALLLQGVVLGTRQIYDQLEQ